MLKKSFDEGFFKFIEKNNLSKEEVLRLVLAFSRQRKKIDYLEERKERHKRLLIEPNFRNKLLTSDLDISLSLLDAIKRPKNH